LKSALKVNLHQIIVMLEEPLRYSPSDSDTLYQADLETLGILYAAFVCNLARENSTIALPPRYKSDHRRKKQSIFTRESREFLRERASELLQRKHTAEDLKNQYYPKEGFPDDFAPDSLESVIVSLAQEERYEEIGAAIKEGASQYHQKHTERDQVNYSPHQEYHCIHQAVLEIVALKPQELTKERTKES